jgi:WS/DGAT/MGAT family acyltransferase
MTGTMRQLSGQDAAFLYGETANWHMQVSGLIIIDAQSAPEPWTYERFREILISRIPEIPQLRWRLVDVPFGLDRPSWVEEPDIDPDYHIRRIALPRPGGPEELNAVVGRLSAYKLDRDRPLWEAWCIEGLEGGRVALFQKMHHAIVDGVSGAGLAEVLLDMEPEPRVSSTEVHEEILDSRVPSSWELLARAALRTWVRTPFRVARFTRQSVQQAVSAVPILNSDQDFSFPLTTPRTILNHDPTARRAFTSARLDLARVKELKDAYGVKVNDVVLALVSSALREYLKEVDELPQATLIAQCPVSLRSSAEEGDVGNKVGSIFTSLATDVDDPAERIGIIYESTQSAKEMREAMAAHQIMGLTETTPPGLIALAARMYTGAGLASRTPPAVSVVVSNVPGPDFPLYVAGGRVEALYPLGPLLMGMSLNITVFSMSGNLDVGVMYCPDTLPQAEKVAEYLEQALGELEAAAPR